MKKLMMVVGVALMASSVFALGGTRKAAKAMVGSDEGPMTVGKAAKVRIDQMPQTGRASCLGAPGISGQSMIGQCFKKPRSWIVCETKYTTYGSEKSHFLPQLTFTWHILLETKSATENKGNKEGLAPYSYFTTAVTYYNIPWGTHASSVCLPPSYLEHYGEPKAIGFVVTNENGDELGGDCISAVSGIKNSTKFWDDQTVMGANGPDGKPMIERRQGLLDRSKTIWALVNPNDYETTLQ